MKTTLCQRVYRYWRQQGLSPQDSREQVEGFLFRRFWYAQP